MLGRQHFLDTRLHPYAAHVVDRIVCELKSDDTVLVVKGQIIDTISFVSAPIHETNSTFWGISELEGAIRAVTELSAYTAVMEYLGTSKNTADQLLFAVIAEKNLGDELEDVIKGHPAISLLLYLRYWLPDIAKYRNSLPEDARTALISIKSMIAELGDLLGVDIGKELTKQEQEIGSKINSQKATYGRLFGVTKQGRVVNAQFKAKEGDAVAILQGGVTPFVLRPIGNRFKFVADACVPGMMYGEAYKNVDPEEVDYQIYLV